MAPEFYILRTFIIGFCLGIGLFVFLHVKYRYSSHEHSENCIIDRYKINTSHQRTYDSWFQEMGFRKQILNNDELRYTDIHGETESEWLHRTVSVVCVVYTSNPKNVIAVNETWSKSCNEVIFYSKNSDNYKPSVPASKSNVTSSFHLLCDVINKVVKDYPHIKWALFVKDDMFVIPENLRRMVAALDPWQGHYLGHTISFWGVSYNMALAGFVLSAGAMRRLGDMFPNTTACIQGGKYWKQEDMYLGKHLRSMNIFPVDTRDEEGFSAFIGYDLDKMMFPGSTQQFTIYNTRALYPPKCCGSRIVTFPVLSSTEMYTYHNMIYKLRIFTSGTRGNRPAPTAVPELQVWQDFLREEGLALNSSDAQYEQSWYIKFGNATAIPGIFGARELDVRKRLGGPNKLFNPTNMPEVLEYMLSNYTAKKAMHPI